MTRHSSQSNSNVISMDRLGMSPATQTTDTVLATTAYSERASRSASSGAAAAHDAPGTATTGDDPRKIAEQRIKKGECPNCRRKTHKVSRFPFHKREALTTVGEDGGVQVLEGRCCECFPLDSLDVAHTTNSGNTGKEKQVGGHHIGMRQHFQNLQQRIAPQKEVPQNASPLSSESRPTVPKTFIIEQDDETTVTSEITMDPFLQMISRNMHSHAEFTNAMGRNFERTSGSIGSRPSVSRTTNTTLTSISGLGARGSGARYTTNSSGSQSNSNTITPHLMAGHFHPNFESLLEEKMLQDIQDESESDDEREALEALEMLEKDDHFMAERMASLPTYSIQNKFDNSRSQSEELSQDQLQQDNEKQLLRHNSSDTCEKLLSYHHHNTQFHELSRNLSFTSLDTPIPSEGLDRNHSSNKSDDYFTLHRGLKSKSEESLLREVPSQHRHPFTQMHNEEFNLLPRRAQDNNEEGEDEDVEQLLYRHHLRTHFHDLARNHDLSFASLDTTPTFQSGYSIEEGNISQNLIDSNDKPPNQGRGGSQFEKLLIEPLGMSMSRLRGVDISPTRTQESGEAGSLNWRANSLSSPYSRSFSIATYPPKQSKQMLNSLQRSGSDERLSDQHNHLNELPPLPYSQDLPTTSSSEKLPRQSLSTNRTIDSEVSTQSAPPQLSHALLVASYASSLCSESPVQQQQIQCPTNPPQTGQMISRFSLKRLSASSYNSSSPSGRNRETSPVRTLDSDSTQSNSACSKLSKNFPADHHQIPHNKSKIHHSCQNTERSLQTSSDFSSHSIQSDIVRSKARSQRKDDDLLSRTLDSTPDESMPPSPQSSLNSQSSTFHLVQSSAATRQQSETQIQAKSRFSVRRVSSRDSSKSRRRNRNRDIDLNRFSLNQLDNLEKSPISVEKLKRSLKMEERVSKTLDSSFILRDGAAEANGDDLDAIVDSLFDFDYSKYSIKSTSRGSSFSGGVNDFDGKKDDMRNSSSVPQSSVDSNAHMEESRSISFQVTEKSIDMEQLGDIFDHYGDRGEMESSPYSLDVNGKYGDVCRDVINKQLRLDHESHCGRDCKDKDHSASDSKVTPEETLSEKKVYLETGNSNLSCDAKISVSGVGDSCIFDSEDEDGDDTQVKDDYIFNDVFDEIQRSKHSQSTSTKSKSFAYKYENENKNLKCVQASNDALNIASVSSQYQPIIPLLNSDVNGDAVVVRNRLLGQELDKEQSTPIKERQENVEDSQHNTETDNNSASYTASINDISIILECVKVHPSAKCTERAFQTLFLLSTDPDPVGTFARKEILENEGIEAMVLTIWKHMENGKVILAVLHALWAVSVFDIHDKDNLTMVLAKIEQSRALEAVLFSLQTHPVNLRIMESGCDLIQRLSPMLPPRQPEVRSAIIFFANCIRHLDPSTKAHRACLSALHSLCQLSDENKHEFANCRDELHSDFCRVLISDASDLETKERICELYWCVSSVAGSTLGCIAKKIIDSMKYLPKNKQSSNYFEAACGTLTNLALDPENHMVLVDAGALTQIANAIQSFDFSEAVLSASCTALANLSTSRCIRPAIISHGGVSALIASMKSAPTSAEIQGEASRALLNLCDVSMEVRKVTTEHLFLFFDAHYKHDDIILQEIVSSMLSKLSKEDIYRKEMISTSRTFDVLVRLFKLHPSNKKIQKTSLLTLRNVSTESSITSILLNRGFIPLVVSAMSAFPNDVDIQESSCIVLRNLGSLNSEAAVEICSEEGINFIVKAMQNLSDCAPTQRASCGALWTCIHESDANSRIAVSSGVIDAVICLVLVHPSDVFILENVMMILESLSSFGEYVKQIVDAGGVSLVVETMRSHPSSTKLIRHGSIFIANLTQAYSSLSDEAVRCVTAIIRCIDENPTLVELIVDCSRTLHSLVSHSRKCKDRLLAANGLGVVEKIINQNASIQQVNDCAHLLLDDLLQ